MTSPSPSPSVGPTPSPSPSPSPTPPPALNLFRAQGFRFQDPNYHACVATAAQDMLNFIAILGTGGPGFHWHLSLESRVRDNVLRWARLHDTLATWARGSDPHGWRNALNFYGWGSGALTAGNMVYVDQGFSTYSDAIRAAVRQLVLTRKPVGMLGWGGSHAQMITGYYGLVGNPLAKNPDGTWAGGFTVAGLYISDPLRGDGVVNRPVSLNTLRFTANLRLRFRRYFANDSPYDDPYTPGIRASRAEWYGRYVLLLPMR